MPTYMEVVAELLAEGFRNSGRVPQAKILKVLPGGPFRFRVGETVRGVMVPESDYETPEEAKAALIGFWERCDQALQEMGTPDWRDI